MNIKELMDEAWQTAEEKGWHEVKENEAPRTIPELLCLTHSELSEALESHRNNEPVLWYRESDGKPEGLAAELADVFIRIAEFSRDRDIPLEEAIRVKLVFNKTRPHRHGGKKL